MQVDVDTAGGDRPFRQECFDASGLTPNQVVGHQRVAGVGIQQAPFDRYRGVEACEDFAKRRPRVFARHFDGQEHDREDHLGGKHGLRTRMGTQHLIYVSANPGEAHVLEHSAGLGGSRDYRLPAADSLLVGVPPDVDFRRVGVVVLIRAGVVFGQFPLTVQLVQTGRVWQTPRGVTFRGGGGQPGACSRSCAQPPDCCVDGVQTRSGSGE